jgi:shikimate kinase
MNVMAEDLSNIVLIGMPGSGKSTVGAILAKLTSRSFIDTDVLIQTKQGRSLQDIFDHDGYLALRAIEEKVLLDLGCRSHVIATGGSAVYSRAAMEHLKSYGIVGFLNVDLGTLKSRVHDFETRGLAKRSDQSVADLFAERSALYRQYADVTIDSVGFSHEEVCARIIEELKGMKRKGCSSDIFLQRMLLISYPASGIMSHDPYLTSCCKALRAAGWHS